MNAENLPFEFTGTLDGPDDVDLIELSGLDLTEEQIEKLWSTTSPLALIQDCRCVDEIESDDSDGMPGQSDTFFTYVASSLGQFRQELRSAIQNALAE